LLAQSVLLYQSVENPSEIGEVETLKNNDVGGFQVCPYSEEGS
jgi:hypothetical protein